MKEYFILSNKKKINVIEDDTIIDFKCILINIHGLGSHFQPVYDCPNELNRRIENFKLAKIKTFAIELTGHGKSDMIKGYFGDFDNLIIDVKNLIDVISYKHKKKPIYLIGESMGGAVAIKFSLLYKHLISGVILLAPLCGIPKENIPGNTTKRILYFLSEYFPHAKLLGRKSVRGCLNKKYNLEREKNNHSYQDKVMLKTGKECVEFCDWLKKHSNDFDLPILIFHAENDNITSFDSTLEFFNNIISKDKKLINISEGHHSILVPIKDDDVFPTGILLSITNWINYRT